MAAEGHETDTSVTKTLGPGSWATVGVASWLLSRSAAFRRYVLIGYWAGIFVLTHWPKIEDFPGAGWLPDRFDLFVHFCMYGGWVVMWWWVLAGDRALVGRRAVAGLLLGGAVYGVFDEVSQAVVGRSPDVIDWMADLTGMAVGLLLLGWWSRRRARMNASRHE